MDNERERTGPASLDVPRWPTTTQRALTLFFPLETVGPPQPHYTPSARVQVRSASQHGQIHAPWSRTERPIWHPRPLNRPRHPAHLLLLPTRSPSNAPPPQSSTAPSSLRCCTASRSARSSITRSNSATSTSRGKRREKRSARGWSNSKANWRSRERAGRTELRLDWKETGAGRVGGSGGRRTWTKAGSRSIAPSRHPGGLVLAAMRLKGVANSSRGTLHFRPLPLSLSAQR